MVAGPVNNILWRSVPQLIEHCMESYPGFVSDLLPGVWADAPHRLC